MGEPEVYEENLFDQIISSPTDPLNFAILCVAGLILLLTVASLVISIVLAVRYVKYNKRRVSCGLTGKQTARQLLDNNDLRHIRVTCSGSIAFGNSYSHFFKKVRLRRRTWEKDSITSVAMAAQKTGLAVLDKEGDKSMKTRIVLTPITFFGPFALFPLVIIGLLIDIFLNHGVPIVTLICAGLGLLIFLASFVIQIFELKTEVAAQGKAIAMMREYSLATEDEIADMKALYRLYNIEYINNIVVSTLEIIYRILLIIAKSRSKK